MKTEIHLIDIFALPEENMETQTDRTPRLFYVREFRKNSRRPRTQATVFYQYNSLTGELKWAASFCNATEDQFQKKTGRDLALQRYFTTSKDETLIPCMHEGDVRKHIRRNLKLYKEFLKERNGKV